MFDPAGLPNESFGRNQKPPTCRSRDRETHKQYETLNQENFCLGVVCGHIGVRVRVLLDSGWKMAMLGTL